jgi:hypothetical protein
MENKQEFNYKRQRERETKYRYNTDFPVTFINDSSVYVFIIFVKSSLIHSNKLEVIKSLLTIALPKNMPLSVSTEHNHNLFHYTGFSKNTCTSNMYKPTLNKEY